MFRALALAATSLVAAATLNVAPAGAASHPSPCPSMTDSISRLYSAFFLREPDQEGFEYWVGVYSSTYDGLNAMANNFVRSDEFVARYGALSDQGFVTMVYRNVLGREPDADGLDHWVAALRRGFDRGSVMISFSESAEYVALTGTVEPLAGFGRWYPTNVTWACGRGPALVDAWFDHSWVADVHVRDGGPGGAVEIVTLDGAYDYNDDLFVSTLAPGEVRTVRRVAVDDVSYIAAYPTTYLDVWVAPTTDWIVVSWPT